MTAATAANFRTVLNINALIPSFATILVRSAAKSGDFAAAKPRTAANWACRGMAFANAQMP
jgi:hypothetical protein